MKRFSVLGHPLHVPFVHLPLSLLPLSFILQVWAVITAEGALWRVAENGLLLGLLAGAAAMVTGFMDFLSLPDGHQAENTAQAHFVVMSLGLSLFLGAWLLARAQADTSAWGSIACSAAGSLTMLVGGWLGGQLVYRHGVGRQERGPAK